MSFKIKAHIPLNCLLNKRIVVSPWMSRTWLCCPDIMQEHAARCSGWMSLGDHIY